MHKSKTSPRMQGTGDEVASTTPDFLSSGPGRKCAVPILETISDECGSSGPGRKRHH